MSPMIVKATGDFEPCPEGLHPAICIDVVDLGIVEGLYGKKHKLRLVWNVAQRMKPKNGEALGKPYLVQKTYNMVLHPKSTLGKDLSTWRGKPFTDEETRKGFDLEQLLGKFAYLSVQHFEGREGTLFANVVAVLPLAKEFARPIPDPGYKRMVDRNGPTKHGSPSGEDWEAAEAPPALPQLPDDEECPF